MHVNHSKKKLACNTADQIKHQQKITNSDHENKFLISVNDTLQVSIFHITSSTHELGQEMVISRAEPIT